MPRSGRRARRWMASGAGCRRSSAAACSRASASWCWIRPTSSRDLEARDVGKPLRQAKADALALARYFEFYGGAADKVHGETIPYQAGYTVMTLREPHGVTGHIIPWNYPMQILGRSVGAALAMGNAAVLKPGEDAWLSA